MRLGYFTMPMHPLERSPTDTLREVDVVVLVVDVGGGTSDFSIVRVGPARRGRAAELGQAYLSLSPAGRRKFLLMLARDYGLTRDTAVSAVDRWRGSKEPARALVKSLEAPAVRVMREFVGVPQGVKFVVDLRAELLALGKSDASARALSEDLRPLLGAWFDVAFLDLVRIDWRASASLLARTSSAQSWRFADSNSASSTHGRRR